MGRYSFFTTYKKYSYYTMYRWIALPITFILTFILSLWIYLYTHRIEFATLSLSSAFPKEIISIDSLSISFIPASLSCNNVQIQDQMDCKKKFRASKIVFQFSPLSFSLWAITPSQSPLPVKSLIVNIDDISLPLHAIVGKKTDKERSSLLLHIETFTANINSENRTLEIEVDHPIPIYKALQIASSKIYRSL